MAIEVEIINKVPEKVQEHKLNTGKTQVSLATRVGMEKQTLNGAFNAKKVPDLDTLAKLSIAMNWDITDLFEIRKISEWEMIQMLVWFLILIITAIWCRLLFFIILFFLIIIKLQLIINKILK